MVSDEASFKINHDNKERGKARVDRLGQNQLITNKYTVRSRYSSWPVKLVKD